MARIGKDVAVLHLRSLALVLAFANFLD